MFSITFRFYLLIPHFVPLYLSPKTQPLWRVKKFPDNYLSSFDFRNSVPGIFLCLVFKTCFLMFLSIFWRKKLNVTIPKINGRCLTSLERPDFYHFKIKFTSEEIFWSIKWLNNHLKIIFKWRKKFFDFFRIWEPSIRPKFFYKNS